MSVTIYHNPRCSKSRQALQLLEERGINTHVVEYLKTPPHAADLKAILDKLGMKPRDLMRQKEVLYKKLKLDDPCLSDDQLIQAMVDNPILIERPIVVTEDGKAALGRPPDKVLEIL